MSTERKTEINCADGRIRAFGGLHVDVIEDLVEGRDVFFRDDSLVDAPTKVVCQSASKIDPLSASKIDPPKHLGDGGPRAHFSSMGPLT